MRPSGARAGQGRAGADACLCESGRSTRTCRCRRVRRSTPAASGESRVSSTPARFPPVASAVGEALCCGGGGVSGVGGEGRGGEGAGGRGGWAPGCERAGPLPGWAERCEPFARHSALRPHHRPRSPPGARNSVEVVLGAPGMRRAAGGVCVGPLALAACAHSRAGARAGTSPARPRIAVVLAPIHVHNQNERRCEDAQRNP